jgi:hypothetical protein
MSSPQRFWSVHDEYGVFHEAGSGELTNILIVYVHGMFGHCVSTWEKIPREVVEGCAVNCDVFSFDYPANPWERCSGLHGVANQLRGWIRRREQKRRKHYEFIFFVTHGAGGLIVKKLMTEALAELQARLEDETALGDLKYDNLPNTVTHLRKVLFLCVPHQGASKFATYMFLYPYISLSNIFGPILSLFRHLSNGRLAWGINRIAWQLCHASRTTSQLERDFHLRSTDLRKKGYPQPDCEDVTGLGDIAVAVFGPASVMRGNHSSVKTKVIELLAPLLTGYDKSPERFISDYTISRCWDLDFRLRVKRLVPDEGAPNEARNRGAQKSIVGSLLGDILSETGLPRFRTFVLTGEAGVGKSTALRAISRELALDFRDQKDAIGLLPITLPLQQVKVPVDSFSSTSTESAERLLWHLLGYWCSWISELGEVDLVTIGWLRNWLRKNPSVLILDGLDEFFINNIGIDSELITAMLTSFGSTLRDETTAIKSHTALLAVRNSYPGHDQFASRATYVFLIEKLTDVQALLIYPEMKEVLQGLRGTATLSVLLTPLIISCLGPRAKELSAELLQTKSVVMRHALDAIIDESHLGSHLVSLFGAINMSDMRTTLTIVGWLFFRDNKGIMSLSEIQAQSQVLADDWVDQVRSLEKGDEIMRAFQLLANEEVIQIVMERTVFVSTGVNHWRFAHREWQDFLTASYMANAYYYSNFVEMGHRAMTRAIFKMMGEILTTLPEKFEITESFTEKILKTGGLAAVNLAGVVGNSALVVHPRAIEKFLSIGALDHMDKTARLIVFTAVMYRALRKARDDSSATDLRRALIVVCNEYGLGHKNEHRDALTASLAWCYHQAMAAGDARIHPPKSDWPGLGFELEYEEPVLSMLTAGRDRQFHIEPRHRSLQVAFLEILPIVVKDPYRPVSIAHYLYTLVVVYRHAAHIPEISRELPLILADDSKYAEIFREYKAVPELWTIFTNCQAAYRDASAPPLP